MGAGAVRARVRRLERVATLRRDGEGADAKFGSQYRTRDYGQLMFADIRELPDWVLAERTILRIFIPLTFFGAALGWFLNPAFLYPIRGYNLMLGAALGAVMSILIGFGLEFAWRFRLNWAAPTDPGDDADAGR